jgi:hypothetical protein
MELEESFPRTQEPSACPYLEPDKSSPYDPTLCVKSILILSSHLR